MNWESIENPTPMNLLIAFTDLDGFVIATKKIPPNQLVAMLSSLYELTGDLVESAGGIVIKFIGDSSLIVFPEENIKTGVEALQKLKRMGEEYCAKYGYKTRMSIKAHVGSVICTKIGTKTDKRFDIFGEAVNQTALLPKDGIVLSETLQNRIKSS